MAREPGHHGRSSSPQPPQGTDQAVEVDPDETYVRVDQDDGVGPQSPHAGQPRAPVRRALARRPEAPGTGAPALRRAPLPHPVSYTHLRAHETDSYLVCRL